MSGENFMGRLGAVAFISLEINSNIHKMTAWHPIID
jgi:hypothetical protein